MPLTRLYSAGDSIEAHLLKHMLDQQGIACYITGEHLEGATGELPTTGLVDVWVIEEQLDDALDVLDDFLDRLDGIDDDGGESVDDDGLIDEDGYYDEFPEDGEQDKPPAHDDPANPWNRVYQEKNRKPRGK